MGRALYDSKSTSIGDRGVGELLSEKIKLATWLEVEAALARAQAEEGLIPRGAADDICSHARLECLDLDEMARIKAHVGHGFVPFVKVLVAACEGEGAKYVHYGATTQNIQQTSQLLIAKRVDAMFQGFLADIFENLARLGRKHADAVMPGRTHGRHATPVTYGYKVAVWASEAAAAAERLEQARPRVFQAMMGGAVGAFSTTGEVGRRVQDRVAAELGMGSMAVPSRAINGFKEEYVMGLALLCHVFHKMAEEVYYTGIEEFGEVSEEFVAGTVGSSTMPQKINPKLAKGIIANSEKLYSLVPLGLYAPARMFEADSGAYMQMDALLEEALQLTCEVLMRAEELTRTLHVNEDRLYQNACLTGGLDNSEHVMMELSTRVGKDCAHGIVYEDAITAETKGVTFVDALCADPVIASAFTRDEVKQMLAPEAYTGLSAVLAREQADVAEAMAARLRAAAGCETSVTGSMGTDAGVV